jgi:hypothetical protein
LQDSLQAQRQEATQQLNQIIRQGKASRRLRRRSRPSPPAPLPSPTHSPAGRGETRRKNRARVRSRCCFSPLSRG